MVHPLTKKYRRLTIFLGTLSVILTFGPAIFYLIQGFIAAKVVVESIALTMAIAVAAIGSLLCFLGKVVGRQITFRSRIWIITLALFYVLDNALTFILIFAITQILDELVVEPIYKHCHSIYKHNKIQDKRG